MNNKNNTEIEQSEFNRATSDPKSYRLSHLSCIPNKQTIELRRKLEGRQRRRIPSRNHHTMPTILDHQRLTRNHTYGNKVQLRVRKRMDWRDHGKAPYCVTPVLN